MADASEKEDKTEAPTDRKIEQAAERGDVPIAADVRHLAMLTAALALTVGAVPSLGQLAQLSRSLWGNADLTVIENGTAQALLVTLLAETGRILIIPLTICLAAALLGGFGQGKVVIAAARIALKGSNISPLAGLKRLFGPRSLLQFVKTLIKLGVVGWAVFNAGWPVGSTIVYIGGAPLGSSAAVMADSLYAMLVAGVLAAAGVAGVDFIFARFEHRRRLRMTRDELRDEMKNTDGDPYIKARLRAIRLERGRRRMLAQVPKAAVVVMNPTHYAVALAYEHGVSAAPVVIAKGVDRMALTIRERAEQAGVPVVVDPPLARALHAQAALDAPIPIELYQAVAKVITFIMQTATRSRRT